MNKKYYLAQVKCGHVGKNFYIIKEIPIYAESATEAAELARWCPRVKHHDKYAVINIKEITKTAFDLAELRCEKDPYFRAENVQDTYEIKEELYIKRERENPDFDFYKNTKPKCRKTIKDKFLKREYFEELNETEYSFA